MLGLGHNAKGRPGAGDRPNPPESFKLRKDSGNLKVCDTVAKSTSQEIICVVKIERV